MLTMQPPSNLSEGGTQDSLTALLSEAVGQHATGQRIIEELRRRGAGQREMRLVNADDFFLSGFDAPRINVARQVLGVSRMLRIDSRRLSAQASLLLGRIGVCGW